MNIVLLGCPGAGKGTQSKVLCDKYGLTHISTGDLFRAEIAEKTELGLKVEEFVNAGNLVPDGVVVDIVGKKLDTLSGGWLLDGFPRTLPQAEALAKYLDRSGLAGRQPRRAGGLRATGIAGKKIDFVVLLNVSEDVVVKRLAGRGREDDAEDTVRKRLSVFLEQTQPLVAYYKKHANFKEIDGAPPEAEVSAALIAYLDAEKGVSA